MSSLALSIALGTVAGLADFLGGLLLVRRSPTTRSLRYFVALGSGFMLAAAVLEMLPESIVITPKWAPLLVLVGYCGVHLIEHTITPHFHFGEETHHHEFIARYKSYSVLVGLAVHTLFDGVAIASGFIISHWLGYIVFLAVFLHKLPEGFTVASVMLASGQSRKTALNSALLLGLATLAGVFLINLFPSWVHIGLPVSAGVTIYVAATDLVPEVNREPGIRMALVFFAGVAIFFLLRALIH